jgi:hypothetical protein
MTTINSHIDDYLTYYCFLKYPPEYAVLIKGSWGAGKTWFVKKYCERLKEKEQKYLYVSLYGMTTFAEIEDAFFQQLHPILSSKGMAITAKILKGALKTTLKIDLGGDKKEDITVNSQIPDLNIPDYFKNTENCILIFDDLERCALSIENILGYINHFVEHQGLKVIIVANEDQIIKNEKGQPETDKSYKLIKEKLIGKTFAVVPDIDAALSDFIGKMTDQAARDFLQESALAVKEMYSVSRYDNLRILKQTLWDFERLFIALPSEIKNKRDLVRHLLRLLLAFSFEIRHGKILPAEIGKVSKEYFSRFVSKKEEETELTEIIAKYDALDLYELLLTEKCWIDFLDKGIIDIESIKESLLKSRYFQDENTPNWVKLWHYINLNDNEFERLLGRVETEFQNGEYKDSGVIKHVTGLLLMFSEIGLYEKEKTIILQVAKDSIDLLKIKKELVFPAVRSWDPESYGGLGFAGKDIPEFRHLVDYIEDKLKEAKIESMPDAGLALLDIMTSDVRKFYRMVCLCNSSDQIYYETPIFKYIAPRKFLETLLVMNPEDRRSAIFALDKRYEFADINKRLIEELPWLEKVRTIMIEEQKKRVGKVSGYILKSTIEHYMDKFIKKLEVANKGIETDAE